MPTTHMNNGVSHSDLSDVPSIMTQIEEKLEASGDALNEERDVIEVKEMLMHLHALLRQNHAKGVLGLGESDPISAPELTRSTARMMDEYSTMFGMIDRIIRCLEYIANDHIDEQMVCSLRIRELFAMIRRHEAEEQCMLYRSVWLDQGGEG